MNFLIIQMKDWALALQFHILMHIFVHKYSGWAATSEKSSMYFFMNKYIRFW